MTLSYFLIELILLGTIAQILRNDVSISVTLSIQWGIGVRKRENSPKRKSVVMT